jgi:hypothetical protein
MVRVGNYKDDYGTGGKTWHHERGMSPRPLGGYWARFYFSGGDIKVDFLETEQ